MEAKLKIVGGEISSGEFDLDLPATVGRGRDVGVRLAHPLVSRKHCEITEKDGLLHVRDLGSLNGTFIADNRISEAVLHPDELITVGPIILRAIYTSPKSAGEETADPDDSKARAEMAAIISGNKTIRLTETAAPGEKDKTDFVGVSPGETKDASGASPAVDVARTTRTSEDSPLPDELNPESETPVKDDDDDLNDFFKGLSAK